MFYIKYIIIVLHQNRFDPCLAMSMAMPLRDLISISTSCSLGL